MDVDKECHNESITTIQGQINAGYIDVVYTEKSIVQTSKLSQYQNNYNRRSVNESSNQEVQSDDIEDESLDHMSIEQLSNKLEVYNTLFMDNKINIYNAFQIDLISCVQKFVKKTNVTNFLEMSNIFDAMSKVYSCRADDILTSGNKLIKLFMAERKNVNTTEVEKHENKIRLGKKLKLTTQDKLCHKDSQIFKKDMYLSVNLENDIIDYANPSRIILNKFSNLPYWPEYNWPKDDNTNINHEEKYEMEDMSDIIKNGKICPYYHAFDTKCDINEIDDDVNKLDNITTHFDQETSTFEDLVERLDEPMNVDNQNSEIVTHASSSCNAKNISINRQENLDSISQLLPLVNMSDNDYTFFNTNQMHHLKCPSHWKDKFKHMTMTNKKRAIRINTPEDNQTYSDTNFSTESNRKLGNNKYKMEFISNVSEKLRGIVTGRNKCNYYSWKPHVNNNSYSGVLTIIPIRRLKMCNFTTLCPKWYKDEFTKLNNATNQNIPVSSFEQDVSSENDDVSHIETMESHYSLDESDGNETAIIDDNNLLNAHNSHDIQDDDMNEDINIISHCPRYIDMHKLKEYILQIIKPDDNILLSYTLKDLLLQLPDLLPENMINNIDVSVVCVALLHLANEHNFCLENKNDELKISQK